MKIILAGNYDEYRYALKILGLDEKETIYRHSIEVIAGYEFDEVIDYGTAYKMKNY